MSNKLKIAVSGKSGCGNTTVSRLLAEHLDVLLINYTFHDMAKERGLSFAELCTLAEKDDQYDRYLDKKQAELAARGNCVLGSRLAIWLLKEATLKVFLTAAPEIRAVRIAQREGADADQALAEMVPQDERDRQRYTKLYGIDTDQYHFANLVVDTQKGDQHYVVQAILNAMP